MLDDVNKEVIITSLILGDEILEIAYLERRDQADRVGLTKSIVMERRIVAEEAAEIHSILEEIIDKGLLEIRNPAPSLNPRDRIRAGAKVEKPEPISQPVDN